MAERRSQPRFMNHLSMTKMPKITTATEVGYYSVSGSEQYFDKRFLGFLANPSNPEDVEFDLNHGYDSFINEGRTIDPLDGILRCVLVNKKKPQLDESDISDALDADFVCRRGILKTLMDSPYRRRNAGDEGWQKRATLFKGKYYIEDVDDTTYKQIQETIMSYWGWKFPQYVTAPEQDVAPDITRPVINGDKYYSMVTRRIGDHSVLFTGEVDCVDDQNHYVELKTNRIFRDGNHGRDKHNFNKFKLFKWWIQSYLCSIPTILAGFRGEDGVVRHVKTYKTDDLPRIASAELAEKFKWNPAVCVNFVNSFFNFVKSQVVEDDAECVYLLSWQPGEDMTCRRLEPGTYEKLLPDWYIEELE